MLFIAKRQIIISVLIVFILAFYHDLISQPEPCFTDVNDIQIATYNENAVFVHPVYPYILWRCSAGFEKAASYRSLRRQLWAVRSR